MNIFTARYISPSCASSESESNNPGKEKLKDKCVGNKAMIICLSALLM
jgi:hypothetical protein